ncbi:helix-turn-helix domain-containing protein [Actinomycetes bacterium KLBMP 9797]
MPGNRREQARWRREQLLDAALEVFAGKGVDGASVKDVAQAAGIAPGLLYHYFESKEALVGALLAERGFLPRLRELLTSAPDGRPATRALAELLTAFDQLLADNAALMSLFFGTSHARAAMTELVGEGQRLLGDFLAARVAAGELRPHDTRTAAATLFAAIAIGRRTGSPVDVPALVELVYPTREGQ